MSDTRKTSWFSEIYEGFILRDLLSFVIPGALAILGFTYVVRYDIYGSSFLSALGVLKDSLVGLKDLGSIAAFSSALLIFGIAYIIGFLVQEIGVFSGFIIHFRKDCICHILEEKYNNKTPSCGQIYLEHYYLLERFAEFSNDNMRKINERNIVLRQMIGNTSTSIMLICIMKGVMLLSVYCLKVFVPFPLFFICLILIFVLFIILLVKIHRELLRREFYYRLQTINNKQGKDGFNDPILWSLPKNRC